MNVCLDLTPLLTTSRFRGIGSYILGLARALLGLDANALDGIRLHVLVGPGLAMRVAPLSEEVLSPSSTGAAGRVMPDTPYYGLKQTVALYRLSLSGMDLYHSTEPKGTPRPPRCLTIATCHDLIPVVLRYPFDPPVLPTGARRIVELLRYRTLDHVVAISECTKRDLRELLGLREDRISVVPNGVDGEVFHPRFEPDEPRAIRELLGTERPYFLYVGGFDPRKQVPALIEAYAERQREIEEDLVVCGDIEPAQRAAVEERLARVPDRRRVILLGFVPPERLPALYRQSTAHVLFSRYEGFGLTLVEAMACGCPVLALATSSVPEIVGDAALLVDPGPPVPRRRGFDRSSPTTTAVGGVARARNTESIPSPSRLATDRCGQRSTDQIPCDEVLGGMGEAMVRVSTDPELRHDLRERGLARAARFTWDRCARELVEVYRKVLGS